MKKKYIIITVACLFLIVAGVSYSCTYKKNNDQEILLSSDSIDEVDFKTKIDDTISQKEHMNTKVMEFQASMEKEVDETLIYVHICGAVVNADVYKVGAGTRLVDLIDAAGGLKPDAANDYINQAMAVEDGQRIYIPTIDELKDLSIDSYVKGDNNNQVSEGTSIKININTADESELMSLPGIGQAKAKSIIEYRKKKGSFKDISELMSISGIKEGLFAQIEDLVIVK